MDKKKRIIAAIVMLAVFFSYIFFLLKMEHSR